MFLSSTTTHGVLGDHSITECLFYTQCMCQSEGMRLPGHTWLDGLVAWHFLCCIYLSLYAYSFPPPLSFQKLWHKEFTHDPVNSVCNQACITKLWFQVLCSCSRHVIQTWLHSSQVNSLCHITGHTTEQTVLVTVNIPMLAAIKQHWWFCVSGVHVVDHVPSMGPIFEVAFSLCKCQTNVCPMHSDVCVCCRVFKCWSTHH